MSLNVNFARNLFKTLSLFCAGFAVCGILRSLFRKCAYKRLKNSTSNQKLAKFSEEKSFFYLINDVKLAKRILDETKQPNGYFVSQFVQPYLLVDSECKFKITKYEHNTVICSFALKCFRNTRQTFVDVIFVDEFEKNLCMTQSSLGFVHIDAIFALIFKIGTVYLKNIIQNETIATNKLSESDADIYKQLMILQEKFNLNLFINHNKRLTRDYTHALSFFMSLVEKEFAHESSLTNSQMIKFLFVKNFYLDLLLVNSIVSNFLYDISARNNTELLAKVFAEVDASKSSHLKANDMWKFARLRECVHTYFVKYLATDLLTINSNSTVTDSPNRFDYFHENCLIGINLHAMLYERKLFEANGVTCDLAKLTDLFDLDSFYFDSNNLILNLAMCLCYSLLKNFNMNNITFNGHQK